MKYIIGCPIYVVLTTKAMVPDVLNLPPRAQMQVIKMAKKTEIAVRRNTQRHSIRCELYLGRILVDVTY